MDKKLIVVLVFVLLLIITIPLSIWAFNLFNIQDILSGADTNVTPEDINVTNVTENSFTVTWWTPSSPSEGSVKFGPVGSVSSVAYDDRADGQNDKKFETHSVTIASLNPDTEYEFSVVSNGVEHKRVGDRYFKARTLPSLDSAPTPYPIIGEVSDNSVGEDAIVYIYLENNSDDQSIVYSTTTAQNGTFSLDIGTIRNTNIRKLFEKTENTQMKLVAMAKSNLAGEKSDTLSDDAGAIDLSETKVNFSFPIIDYSGSDEEPANEELSISSPSDGDELESLSRVRGYTNPNENLTVEISGPVNIGEEIVSESSGYYSYYLDEPLSSGTYTLTVTSNDRDNTVASVGFRVVTQDAGGTDDDTGDTTGDNTNDTNSGTGTDYYNDYGSGDSGTNYDSYNTDDTNGGTTNTNTNTNTNTTLPSTGVEDYIGIILASLLLIFSLSYLIVTKIAKADLD